MSINPDSPVKEYTGVWIPADVMECEKLSSMEKILYGEIAGFRQCYASNAWLASRIGRSERTTIRLITHLIELGFVRRCGFNGRFRLIQVCQNCHVCHDKNAMSDVSKMTPINKSIDKSINNNKLDKSEFGDKNVNELMTYWSQKIGIKASQSKPNRNACATLIRQKGIEGAKRIVDLIYEAIHSQGLYAPSISSFADLYGAYGKMAKLEAFAIRLEAKNASERKISALYRNSVPVYDEPTDDDRAQTSKAMKVAREKLFGDK